MRASVLSIALALLFAPCTASATYLTLAASGTLDVGSDPGNLFGTNNPDISGQPFDLTLIFDETVPSDYSSIPGPTIGELEEFSYIGGPSNGYPVAMWAWLTVAGHQIALTGDSSTFGSYYPYRPYFNLTDNDVSGHHAILTLNYIEEDFSVFDLGPQYIPVAYGDFSPQSYSLTTSPGSYTPTAIPEPAAWAMMIGGFGGVGAMLRRRRARRTGDLAAASAA